jgi:hypothetical protein
MFEHLDGYEVFLWHLYVAKNQNVPPHGTALIAGGTTTGLRTITLFYSMGYRQFELYGFDSCLRDGKLRMNGDAPNNDDAQINEIVVDGKMFYCNPSMTAQANEFQNLYAMMPDIKMESHGDGLITAIIEARKKQARTTVSFIHMGGPDAASYRYRAQAPAQLMGASLNDMSAEYLYIAKPDGVALPGLIAAKESGKKIIIDFCDDHFDRPHYLAMLELAHSVSCPTQAMADRIKALGREATVIDDPYEFPELPPHCAGNRLLWFGHAVNYLSLKRILSSLDGYPLRIVSNIPGTIPWSLSMMTQEFAQADIVIIPATAEYKSPNRAVESIRQGCFVVAEPHPALNAIPGIWLGNIKDGIEWASKNQAEANQRIKLSQAYVAERFAPRIQAFAMNRIIQELSSTLEVGTVTGMSG